MVLMNRSLLPLILKRAPLFWAFWRKKIIVKFFSDDCSNLSLKWDIPISVDFSILFQGYYYYTHIYIYIYTHTSHITLASHVRWNFLFFIFGFTCFTNGSFILFFILRKSCISPWLLIWERNVKVGKKQFSDNKKWYVCGKKKKAILFLIFFFKNKKLW